MSLSLPNNPLSKYTVKTTFIPIKHTRARSRIPFLVIPELEKHNVPSTGKLKQNIYTLEHSKSCSCKANGEDFYELAVVSIVGKIQANPKHRKCMLAGSGEWLGA